MANNIMRLSLIGIVVLAAGCKTLDFYEQKKEEEGIRNTIDCQYQGERLVIRYGKDEVRVLLPSGERVDLYKIPSSPKGTLYSNGEFEFLTRGGRMTFGSQGNAGELTCKPYSTDDDPQPLFK